MWSAGLSSAKLVIFVVSLVYSQHLQVIVPNSLESIVAMEIIAADIIRRVGGTDPPEGHRAQLGLNGIISSILYIPIYGLTLIYQHILITRLHVASVYFRSFTVEFK